MKLIRSLRLQRQQKPLLLCEIQLFELAEQGYLVNLRQWREGQEGRDSTRTPQPVSLVRAQQLFQTCQIERQAQGFLPLAQQITSGTINATVSAAPAVTPAPVATTAIDHILLERLQAAHWQTLNPKQRSRLIWRIGERRLSRAVPLLVSLLGQGTSLQDYSLAYAIGRAGDAGALQAMQELQQRSGNLSVQRMAQQAWWQLASREQKQQAAHSLIDQWPRKVCEAWQTQEESTMLAALLLAEQHRSLRLDQSLPQLDLIAHAELPESPLARRIVLAQAETLAILPGAFRALRYLYKAAEMRGDAMLWGILAQRFETVTAGNRGGARHLWLDRRWVPYRQEAQSDNSRVAYSKFTRDYLRRRSWRTLRRLAQDDPSAYVAMATSALLAMDDAQAKAASKRTFVTRQGPQTRYYGPYSHWLLLNRLLHSNGPWRSSRDGGSWYQISPITSADTLDTKRARQEAFPLCWDQAPNAAAMLLQLLLLSRCAAVHQFAARALLDHPQFCATLEVSVLSQLLASP
ncbi:MAG: hypothetical protein HYZ45_10250, partial [Burkholderiales bacterium]|nr:hypothetical protein [Burkholderiales bacterium]